MELPMSMSVPVARLRIARDVIQCEEALNEALLRHSALFTSMVAARKEIHKGAFLAQDALLRLSRSQQSLLEAHSDLARVHSSLMSTQREMGVGDECPEGGPIGGQLKEA